MKTGRIKDGYGSIQRDVMTSKLNVYSKVVYCLLISYAGDKTYCYPSLKTMCENLDISKPTIIKAIKELIENGLLVADKQKTAMGEHENNVYYPMYIMDENVVNDVNHPGKQIYNGSNSGLPPVVNDVDSKINNSKINIEDKINGDLFNGFGLKEKKSKFKKPTLEELEKYFEELGYLQLSGEFQNHYTSNGWKVGKNPMVDWNAAARGWVTRYKEKLAELEKQAGTTKNVKSFIAKHQDA